MDAPLAAAETGLVTVVTGANSGIGRATAIHLAEQGQTVYGTVRDTAKATKLLAMAGDHGVEVKLVELDVGEDASVRDGLASVLAEAGRVDVMVNNAGIAVAGVAEETDPSVYLEHINVNVCGAVRCIKAVLPGMRERGSGVIVNVTSIAGRIAALAAVSVRRVEMGLRGHERGLGAGGRALRCPRRDRRAGCDEVGDLREERRRAARDRRVPTRSTGGCSSSTPRVSAPRPIPSRWRA